MNRFANAAAAAANDTDEQLKSLLSGLTRLTDEQIQDFFPERKDQQSLLRLLDLVHSSTEDNEKIARIAENAGTLGAAAIKIMKLLS